MLNVTTLSLKTILEILVNVARMEERNKNIITGKEETNLLFFADTIICIKNPRESTEKLLKEFSKAVRNKMNIHINGFPTHRQ